MKAGDFLPKKYTHIISHKVENILFIFIIGEFYREKNRDFFTTKETSDDRWRRKRASSEYSWDSILLHFNRESSQSQRNRAALPCTHIYICISEWRNIKKFSAKKSTHKKSEVEGKRTHQESRYGFDVEKRKKKGRRELDEPLSSKTSKKTEREKKKLNKKSVEANIERSRSF